MKKSTKAWIIEQLESMLILLGIFFALGAWEWLWCWIFDEIM